MELRITTLSENTAARPGLLAEWGLSLLVEAENLKVLLDVGQGISAVHNALVLGIDLHQIDKIILSHGHFDHTGGLRDLLSKRGKEVEVIAHPEIWSPKYAYRRSEKEHYEYIGIPFPQEELESLGASFTLSREPVWLAENIATTGEIPMVTDYEKLDADLYVKQGSEWHPDQLLDDQALIIRTEQGLVVILGCAHRGIVNTLRYAQELMGVELIHTVIGGIHLFRAPEEQVELTIAELKGMGIKRLGVSHCTGLPQASRLAYEFGRSFFFNNAGTLIEPLMGV